MKKRLLFVAALLCLPVVIVGFAGKPQARGQEPANPGQLTVDQKLNLILDRLDRIEKTLGIAPKSIPPATRKAVAPSAPAARRLTARAALPDLPEKPTPHSSTYEDCGPRGKKRNGRGDLDLNYLKNRIDEADEWIPVDFDAVLNQSFPDSVGKVDRADWDDDDSAQVKRYEGLPISIECYFAWAKDEGPESCNCHIEEKSMYDIHTWLTKEPAEINGSTPPDRSRAIVAEVTPRLKPDHPAWTQATIRRLSRNGTKVRVSGWLMLDQEHPEQLDKTRGTLWEIHPIMEIEVFQNGQWIRLDELQSKADVLELRPAA
jgi:hypothetical protein